MTTLRKRIGRIGDWFSITKSEILVLGLFLVIGVLVFVFWSRVQTSTNPTADILLNLGTEFGGAILAFIILELILRRLRLAEGRSRKGFDYKRFIRDIEFSTDRIRVLSTFIYPMSEKLDARRIRETGVTPELQTRFFQVIEQRLRDVPDLKIRFLLLDPFSFAAYQREKREPGRDIRRNIRENLYHLYRWRARLEATQRTQVEVRVFDDLPPFALLQADKRNSMIFFERGPISKSERFEILDGTPLASFLERSFDTLWEDYASRDLDSYVFVTLKEASFGVEFRVPFVKDPPRFELREVEKTKRFWLLLNPSVDSHRELMDMLRHPSSNFYIRWRDEEHKCVDWQEITNDHGGKEMQDIVITGKEKYGNAVEFHSIHQVRINRSF